MSPGPRSPSTMISAVVSDVDGTLVTDDKLLTVRTQAAVARLRADDIAFAIISSRPPRGLRMLKPSSGSFLAAIVRMPWRRDLLPARTLARQVAGYGERV